MANAPTRGNYQIYVQEAPALHEFKAIDDAFAGVQSYEDLHAPMAVLAATAGMTHYAALRVRGATFMTLLQQVHNAPESHIEQARDLAYWRASPLVSRLISGTPPCAYDGSTDQAAPADIPGFKYGVAASCIELHGACLLFLARDSHAITASETMQTHMVSMLGATRMHDALSRLNADGCQLSSRQLDCLRHAMAGHTAAETARALGLSARTVEQYLERARGHLGAPNSLAAAVRAIDQGWITPAEVYALTAA